MVISLLVSIIHQNISSFRSLYRQIAESLEEFAKAGKDDFLLGCTVLAETGHRREDCCYISTCLADGSIPERSLDELAGRLAL